MELCASAVPELPSQGCVLFAAEGPYAASARGRWVHVTDLHDGASVQVAVGTSVAEPVTALALCCNARLDSSDGPRTGHCILFAASTRCVAAWDLDEAFADQAQGQPPDGPIVLHSGMACVQHMSISADGTLLALCIGSSVGVIDLQSRQVTHRLEGDCSAVVAAAFSPVTSLQLACIGSDRRLLVWDLQQDLLLHQSPVLASAPLTSLSYDLAASKLAVGAADGTVRYFDLSCLPACRGLQVIDVRKLLSRLLAEQAAGSSTASPGPRVVRPTKSLLRRLMEEQASCMQALGPEAAASAAGHDSSSTAAGSVLALHHSPLTPAAPRPGLGLLAAAPLLLVGMPRALLALDSSTYQVKSVLLLGYPERSSSSSSSSSTSSCIKQVHVLPEPWPQPAAAYSFGLSASGDLLLCAVATGSVLRLVQLRPCCSEPNTCAANDEDGDDDAASDDEQRPAEQQQQQQQQHLWNASTSCTMHPAVRDSSEHATARQLGGGWQQHHHHQGHVLSVFQRYPLPAGSPLAVALAGKQQHGISSEQQGLAPRGEPGSSRTGSACDPDTAASATNSTCGPAKRATWAAEAAGSGGRLAAGRPGKKPSCDGDKSSSGKSSSGGISSSKRHAAVAASKPVTFHSKVKSSGYGMVYAKARLGCSKPAAKPVPTRPAAPTALARHLASSEQYPVECRPLARHHHQLSTACAAHRRGGAVTQVAYSPECSWLATASADGTAHVVRMTSSGGIGGCGCTTFLGHKGALRCANWSHDGRLLATAAADGTVRVWSPVQPAALLQMDVLEQQQASGVNRSNCSSSGSSSSKANAEVAWAQFGYMDELLLVAAGNQLQAYRCSLPEGPPDDIKRYQQRGRARLLASFSSSSQALLAASALNACLSTLAICAGSNRSLELVDLATMAPLATIPGAHDRPVHSVHQLAPSAFCSHPREAHELFATAAQDGAVKVWDVRSAACVRLLSGHKNSQMRLGLALSPCMRYLACGSEEAALYMYDLRQGVVLARVKEGIRHDSWIADVAFHPLRPQLVAGCMDGSLQFYGEAAC